MVTQDEANRHLSITTPEGKVQWEIEPAYVNPTLVYYLRGHLMYIQNDGSILWRTRVDGKRRRPLHQDRNFFPYYTTATDRYRVFIYRIFTNDYKVVITDGTETHDFFSPNMIFTPTLWSGNQQTLYVETAINQQFFGNIFAIDVATGEGELQGPGAVSYGLARDNRFIYQRQRQWQVSDGGELPFEPDTVMLDWLDDDTILIGYQTGGKWELYSAALDGTTRTKLLDAQMPPLGRYDNWLYVYTPENALVRFNLQTHITETLLPNAVIFEEVRDFTPIDPLLIYTNVFFVQDHRWIITTMKDGPSFYLVRINPDGSERVILHEHPPSDTVRLYLSTDENWLILDSLYSQDILRINIASGEKQMLPIKTFLFTIPTFEGNWHGWKLTGAALVMMMALLVIGWVKSPPGKR